MYFYYFAALTCAITSALGLTSLEKHVDSLALDFSFKPVKEAYWTGLPHHRRTPFAVSPDGKSAFLAYLDSSETDVHVQQVDPETFTAIGSVVTVEGAKEAGGLIAHDDGFALLTNEPLPSGTTNAPPDSTPIAVLYRYTDGTQTWKTFLGGPDVDSSVGSLASPDLNGDLVYSPEAGLYGAYFVVTAYSGSAAGHYGDSVQYVKTDGTVTTINGATSSWGCSHNTGIAFEAADEAPFASLCAEDQGEIWLNTEGQGMGGVKVSNENTTNGGSGEPMGGMSGSYSNMVRLIDSNAYVFAWVSRGAVDLTENEWLGGGNTQCSNRTNNRNVAIAQFSDKNTLDGEEATFEIGAADGDSQVNWITQGTADASNAHVAAFDSESVVVTWEEIEDPYCPVIAMGCQGEFTGTRFQLVTQGAKVGEPLVETDVYVAGDMVTLANGKVCWPYVSMTWDLSQPVAYGGSSVTSKKVSFACISNGADGRNDTASSTSASGAAVVATSTVVSSGAPSSTAAPSTTLLTSVRSIGSAAAPTSSAIETLPASPSDTAVIISPVNSATVTATSVPTPSSSANPGKGRGQKPPCKGGRPADV
ncbi:hypothetical protein SAMD00023353_0300840 [Rosellinia necatrix]|uniref:Uncharacterized protein n=1 Tax=Rosellinia necatrix TaxID=77044 RepID=A0A1W2TDA3_ROSNE|nr:hypothetical protein SAMD00023353_0300840 [Rosellinia necatrix]